MTDVAEINAETGDVWWLKAIRRMSRREITKKKKSRCSLDESDKSAIKWKKKPQN